MKSFRVSQDMMNRIIGLSFALSICLLAITGIRLRDVLRQEVEAQRQQAYYEEKSRELLEASDYLTEQVRRYVVTGDRSYMDDYWMERLVTKRREAVIEILEQSGLDGNELAFLREAKDRSDYLSYVEIRAMKLMAMSSGIKFSEMPVEIQNYVLNVVEKRMTGEERIAEARRLMFDDQYTFEKETIRNKIERFQSELKQHLEAETAARREHTDRILGLQAGLVVFVALMLVLMLVLFYRYLSVPVSRYAASIRRGEKLTPQGLSELQMLADEYNQMLEGMETASRAKSQFVARMSHEIRTPLTTICGYQYLLEQTKLDETQEEYVSYMKAAGNALLQVVNQVLDFSRLTRETMRTEKTEFSVSELFDQLGGMFRYEAEKKNLRLQLDDRTKGCLVTQDMGKLRQILINLIGNAVKFTETGCVEICGWLEDGRLSVVVSDTGPGISPENQERIFEPFEQSDPSVSSRYGGTGLGLPISRDFARMMGGELTVSSGDGGGSSFLLQLPVSGVRERPCGQQTPGQAGDVRRRCPGRRHPERRYPGRRILLVEDNLVNQQMEAALLEGFGPEVSRAASGREALRKAGEEVYDLIILDLYLDDMDGFCLNEQLRQGRNRETPRVVLTADVDVEHVGRIRREIGGYLSKPLAMEDLSACLGQYLGEGESAKEPEKEEEEAFAELLAGLRADFPLRHGSDIRRLTLLAEENRWDELSKLCHMLKGVCLTIRWNRMAELLRRMEERVGERDETESARLAAAICKEYEKMAAELPGNAGGQSKGAEKPVNGTGGLPGKAEEPQENVGIFRQLCSIRPVQEQFLELLDRADFESMRMFQEYEQTWKEYLGQERFRALHAAMLRFEFQVAADILRGKENSHVSGVICG